MYLETFILFPVPGAISAEGELAGKRRRSRGRPAPGVTSGISAAEGGAFYALYRLGSVFVSVESRESNVTLA